MTTLTENQLDDTLKRMPQSIEPKSDLWPGIEARMLSRAAQARRAHAATVWRMAAGFAIVGAATLMAVLISSGPDTNMGAVAYVPAAEIEYQQVRGELMVGFEERLASLAPETREVIEQNMLNIQQSIEEIAGALDANPNNLSLRRLLYATYEQELDLLGTINRVTGPEPNEGLEI